MLFDELKKDNLSGAAEILQNAADLWRRRLLDRASSESRISLATIRNDALEIIQQQPRMAPLFHLANAVLSSFPPKTQDIQITTALDSITHHSTRQENAAHRLFQNASELLLPHSRIMTFSKSSIVLQTLLAIARQNSDLHILLCESRPMNEGQHAAECLAEHNVSTTFFVDAAMSKAICEADVIVVGADRISERGVTNKIGTHALALLAKEAAKPVYCVATLDKYLPSRIALPLEECHAPDEVWARAPENITLSNHYFEETPAELFSGIVCENGIIEPKHLHRLESRFDSWLLHQFKNPSEQAPK